MESDEFSNNSDSDSYADECFDFDSDILSNEVQKEKEDTYTYNILTLEDVSNDMLSLIKEVNAIVQIPPTTTRILLNHFKWNTEKLYERYYEGDPSSLFKEAHIVNPTLGVPRKKQKLMKTSTKNSELCVICFRNFPYTSMTSLACGHRFCTECWIMYITTKIMDQGEVQYISCFAVDCDILVDDQTIMNLLVDPKVKSKYRSLITNNYILCNRLLRHCPKPGCAFIIKVEYVDSQPVKCSCGHIFCFQCLENWHAPITCNFLKKWQEKCHDDSATLNWISANTKQCPNCNARIEKDGGCNHMICKNQSCKFEFCWLCLRAWNSHEFQWETCHMFNEAMNKNKEHSRFQLDRFLFYYDRYMSHVASLKFENVLYESVGKKIKILQKHHMSWNESQFLNKAVDILCQCRQALMYTYVFAYYLTKTNESSIFEVNQKDLQRAVEELSGFLERDIAGCNILKLKQRIQDKFWYCNSRRKVLLNHVYEGYEKDTWKYWES